MELVTRKKLQTFVLGLWGSQYSRGSRTHKAAGDKLQVLKEISIQASLPGPSAVDSKISAAG